MNIKKTVQLLKKSIAKRTKNEVLKLVYFDKDETSFYATNLDAFIKIRLDDNLNLNIETGFYEIRQLELLAKRPNLKPIAKDIDKNRMPFIDFNVFNSFEIKNELLDAIESSIDWQSTDQSRYVMNGCYIKSNEVVATDGRVLLVKHLENSLPEDISIILPTNACKQIKGLQFDRMKVEGKFIYLYSADIEYRAELIEGNFPNYDYVIPKNADDYSQELMIPDFTGFKKIGDESDYRNSLRVERGKAILQDMEIAQTDKDLTIAVNFLYLDRVRKYSDKIFVKDQLHPLCFFDQSVKIVIMPLRVD